MVSRQNPQLSSGNAFDWEYVSLEEHISPFSTCDVNLINFHRNYYQCKHLTSWFCIRREKHGCKHMLQWP